MAKFRFTVEILGDRGNKEEIVEIPDEDLDGPSEAAREKVVAAHLEHWAESVIALYWDEAIDPQTQ